MAILELQIPDGLECKECDYRIRRTDTKEGGCHCAVFMTRADGKKPKICREHTQAQEIVKRL